MTVIIPESIKCTICDCVSEQPILKSTNTFFGEPDLDLRPPELMRSTMNTWVQRCPNCGYCYPYINKGDKRFKKIISSTEYIEQLRSEEYPELANAFQCLALIYISENKPVAAGEQYHYAAWVCDDNEFTKQAVNCRLKAIQWYENAMKRGESLIEERELETLMMADLCRRIGWFEKALTYCEDGIKHTSSEQYLSFYHREKELIKAMDTRNRSIYPEQ